MMLSLIGRNVFHCCSFFGLQRFDLYFISKKIAWYVAQKSLSPVSHKLNIILLIGFVLVFSSRLSTVD